MAIVFDTQAELEAFCEAFELKNVERERPVRNTRKRSTEQHATQRSTWKRSERTASRTIFLQELESPAVEIQVPPEPQISSELDPSEAEPVSIPVFSDEREHTDVFASAS